MARSMLHKFEKVWGWGHTRAGVGPCMVGEEMGQGPVYGHASPEQTDTTRLKTLPSRYFVGGQ